MFAIEQSLLVVHLLQTGQAVDPDAGSYDPGAGGPAYGGGWTSRRRTARWYRLTTPGGRVVYAWLANVDLAGTRGLFAFFGPTAGLAEVAGAADLALPAREAWRRRNEAAVKTYLRSWPTLNCAGFERVIDPATEVEVVVAFDGVRRVLNDGGRLPDYETQALPWNLAADGSLTTQALARFRITALSGVDTIVMDAGLAALGCSDSFRDEIDPGV